MATETEHRIPALMEELRHSAEAVDQAGKRLVQFKREKRSAAQIAQAEQSYKLAREQHEKHRKAAGNGKSS